MQVWVHAMFNHMTGDTVLGCNSSSWPMLPLWDYAGRWVCCGGGRLGDRDCLELLSQGARAGGQAQGQWVNSWEHLVLDKRSRTPGENNNKCYQHSSIPPWVDLLGEHMLLEVVLEGQ